MNIAANAPASITNTAIAAGGGELNTGNNSSSVTTPVTTVVPVTINTNPAGLSFSVDGVSYNSAQTFNFAVGSQHPIATTSPQAGAPGTQYVWANWSDNGLISHSFTVSTATTIAANFTTQYQLTTTAGAGGTISPASGFYNAGNIQVLATPNPGGFVFSGFSGALTGTTNPQMLNLQAPATVSAAFNRPPTSGGQTEGIAPNTPKTFTLNVNDPDGNALTFLTLAAPTKGVVTYNAAAKQATYTPNPGATGTDSFTYKATDTGGLVTTATVNIVYLSGINSALGFVSRTAGIEGGGACVSGVSIYRITDTFRNASTVTYTGVQGKITAISNATLVELIVDQTADRILSPSETFATTGRVKITNCASNFGIQGTFFGTPYTGTVVFGRPGTARAPEEPAAIGEFSFEGFAGGPTTE